MSDSLLVEQCKQKNRKAQMALYKQYCDGMFVVAHRYLKDKAEAEDAMQESFIKAFRKIDQFKGGVTFGSWLKRIVINTCLDIIKANKMELYSIDEDSMSIADDVSDWETSDETTYQEVISAIDGLAENYKTVVKLYLLDGYDHEEIAEILAITANASRTNLHRGKLLLKDQLNHLRYGTGS